jgi:hypothetical protein
MTNFLARIADWVGIIGVILILIAYWYLSIGRWISDSFKYQFLNFIGAWLILFSLIYHWNLASVVIEIAWVFISIVGMRRACQRKA